MKFIKLKEDLKDLTKNEIYKVIRENDSTFLFKNDLGFEVYINRKYCEILDPKMKIAVSMFDPPSGHMYGFPSIRPKDSLKQKNMLLNIFKAHNYPEKLQKLAMQASRSWNSECSLENLPDYYFGFTVIEDNKLSRSLK